MDDTFTTIITNIVAFAGGGGLMALLNYWNNKRYYSLKEGQTNIETAIKLKDEAVKEYQTAEAKLMKARALLEEVEEELAHAKQYIDVLQDILRENNIDYPEYKNVKGEK